MARRFNLTANLVLAGPNNLRQVVTNIKSAVNNVSANIDVKIKPTIVTDVKNLTSAFTAFNTAMKETTKVARNAAAALTSLNSAVKGVNLKQLTTDVNAHAKAVGSVNKVMHDTVGEMEKFGHVAGLAVRRFAGFALATGIILGFGNAMKNAIGEAIDFQHEMVRLTQIANTTIGGVKNIQDEITRLSTSLGVSSKSLINISNVLLQAGLSAKDTKLSLEALAKTSLAPTFDDMGKTVEGVVAIMGQFGLKAKDMEGALGAMNKVAADFAVESADLITAVRISGGAFSTMSKGVVEGQEALNQFMAVFTSIRHATRESAESIATGLRTIFTRLERPQSIEMLKQLGIELTDVEGKFVGPYEAIVRISDALRGMDTRDIRFAQIAETLGGYRQIGKVLPMLQNAELRVRALAAAQAGQNSLNEAVAKTSEDWSVQLTKVHERFLALIRDITNTSSFKALMNVILGVANSLISLGDAIKPILPYLGILAGFKIAGALKPVLTGFFGGVKGKMAGGGMVPGSGSGDTYPAMLTPGEFVIRKDAVKAIGAENLHKVNKMAIGGPVKFNVVTLDNKPGVESGSITLNHLLAKADKSSNSHHYKFLAAAPGIQEKAFGKNPIGYSYNIATPNKDVKDFDDKARQGYETLIKRAGRIIAGGMKAKNKEVKLPIDRLGYEAVKGHLFEGALLSLGAPYDEQVPNAGFDFYRGLGGAQDYFHNYTSVKFLDYELVEAKKSINNKEKANIEQKIINLLADTAQTQMSKEDLNIASKKIDKANIEKRVAKNRIKNASYGGLISQMFATGGGVEGATINGLRRMYDNPSTPPDDIISVLRSGKYVKMAHGGSSSDTVPAMLTPGEFVINKNAAAKIGLSTLHKMNNADKIQGFAGGGHVQYFDNGGLSSGTKGNIVNLATKLSSWVPQGTMLPKMIDAYIKELTKAANSMKATGMRETELRKRLQIMAQEMQKGETAANALTTALKKSAIDIGADTTRAKAAMKYGGRIGFGGVGKGLKGIGGLISKGVGGLSAAGFMGSMALNQMAPNSVLAGGLSGVMTGAATGASLGSVAGPWGAAIGGVGGAILGGVQGVIDTKINNEMKKVDENLLNSTKQLDKAFEDLAHGGSIEKFNTALLKTSENIVQKETLNRKKEELSLGNLWGFLGGDEATMKARSEGGIMGTAWRGLQTMTGFGDSANKSLAAARDKASLQIGAEYLANRAEMGGLAEQNLLKLAGRGFDFKSIASSGANKASLLALGAAAGLGETQQDKDKKAAEWAKVEERVKAGLATSAEVKKMEDEKLLAAKQAKGAQIDMAAKMTKLTGILVDVNVEFEKFGKQAEIITSKLSTVSVSVGSFDTIIESMMSGPGSLAGMSKAASYNVFSNTSAYSGSQLASTGLNAANEFGVGFNPTIQRGLRYMQAGADFTNSIPQILTSAEQLYAERLSAGGGDYSPAAALEEVLSPIKDAMPAELKKFLEAAIEKAKTGEGGKLAVTFNQAIESLTDEMTKAGDKMKDIPTKMLSQLVQEQINKQQMYLSGLQKQLQLQLDINNKMNDMAQFEAEQQKALLKISQPNRELSISEKFAPVQARMQSLASQGGLAAGQFENVGLIGSTLSNVQSNLRDRQRRIEEINQKMVSGIGLSREDTQTIKELRDLNKNDEQRAVALQKLLELLHTDNTKLQAIQDKIYQLDSQRAGFQKSVIDVAQMSPEELVKFRIDNARAEQFLHTGQFTSREQMQSVIRGIKWMGSSNMLTEEEKDRREKFLSSRLIGVGVLGGTAAQRQRGIEFLNRQDQETQDNLMNFRNVQNIQLNAGRAVIELKTQDVEFLLQQLNAQQQAQQTGVAGAIGRARGGIVGGHYTGRDSVPAVLTQGEYVVKRSAAQANLGLLSAINNGYFDGGEVEEFARGGLARANIMNRKAKYYEKLKAYRQNVRNRFRPSQTVSDLTREEFMTNSGTTEEFLTSIGLNGESARKEQSNVPFKSSPQGTMTIIDMPKRKSTEEINRRFFAAQDAITQSQWAKQDADRKIRESSVRYIAPPTKRKFSMSQAMLRQERTKQLEQEFEKIHPYTGPERPSAMVEGMGGWGYFPTYRQIDFTANLPMVIGEGSDEYDRQMQERFKRPIRPFEHAREVASQDSFYRIRDEYNRNRQNFVNQQLKREGLANGGKVNAMLTPGEFVVNPQAASANLSLLNNINNGGIAHFENGGIFGSIAGAVGGNLERTLTTFANAITKLTQIVIPDNIKFEGQMQHTHILTGDSSLGQSLIKMLESAMEQTANRIVDERIDKDGTTKERNMATPLRGITYRT